MTAHVVLADINPDSSDVLIRLPNIGVKAGTH